MTQPLRFLQLSDLHFGAPLGGGKLRLPAALSRQRRQEKRELFAAAMDLIQERDLDGLLMPGDIFDDESVDLDTLRFVQHQLERIAPRPVFIAPGNHDPYGGGSPWNPDGGAEARGVRWPAHVHIFAHGDFRSVPWPQRPEVLVTGSGVAANVPSDDRRLRQPVERPKADLNLLLFHGSRDDDHWLEAHKSTYPFSARELLDQGFDWVALGHYHAMQILEDAGGRPRAAYAGSLLAGGLDETGDHGALLVEWTPEATRCEFLRLDSRRVHRVQANLKDCGFAEELVAQVGTAIDAAGVGAEDLALVELSGSLQAGLDLGALDRLRDRAFHLQFSLRDLRPALDLDRWPAAEDARSTEEHFVAALRTRLENDPDQVARRALLYGLDALAGQSITPRYED